MILVLILASVLLSTAYFVYDFDRAVARCGCVVIGLLLLGGPLTAQGVHIIPNLQRTSVGGAWVKTMNGTLDFSYDVVAVQSMNKTVPTSWAPTQASDIPFPWPASYVALGQSFSAYTFAQNMIALAKLSQTEGLSPRISTAVSYLIGQLDAYTDTSNRIFYSFPYGIAGHTLTPPWHSALANAQAMQGMLELWRVTNNGQYLAKARALRGPLLLTGGVNTGSTLVDGASWLWFEEYPAINGVPTHVLNGHVIGLFALYRDRQLTGDTSLDNYIRAGIATAARYYWQARRPGEIIRYWIYNYDIADYGPLRAINFAQAMSVILPNPKLSELVDALRTDMSVEK